MLADRMTSLALPLLRALPPETAHRLTLKALSMGLGPQSAARPDPRLSQTLWGMRFDNPVGIAAGFDKNAEAPLALLGLGAGFVEIGAVTPRPQAGNPKPRLFRLGEDRAVINRMGFNNGGLAVAKARLAALPALPAHQGIIGANLGANKDAADRMADYETVMRGLWGLCAFFTVNVSSPNTEKLRDLQGREALTALLSRVLAARDELAGKSAKPPVLLKIAPDLSEAEIADVAAVCLETGVDGVVATNTTIARPESLRSPHAHEKGGLSGAPLFERSTEVLRSLYRLTEGKLPLIGVGGIDGPDAAYAKIRAGASLLQLYTALVYQGPGLIGRIAEGVSERLARDGFSNISEAVGVDTR